MFQYPFYQLYWLRIVEDFGIKQSLQISCAVIRIPCIIVLPEVNWCDIFLLLKETSLSMEQVAFHHVPNKDDLRFEAFETRLLSAAMRLSSD